MVLTPKGRGMGSHEIDESKSARPRLETKWDRDSSYAALDNEHITYATRECAYADLGGHSTYEVRGANDEQEEV